MTDRQRPPSKPLDLTEAEWTKTDVTALVPTETGIGPRAVPLAEAVESGLVASQRLGGYRLIDELGEGGMGKVYRAMDESLNRIVALKVMRPEFAKSPQALERFLREARAGAAVKNDHIVTVYQVGHDHGVPFLALELLNGEVLEARLTREGRLPIDDIARIGRHVARGLAAAHERGLIHRDIKPANIWLEPQPEGAFRAKLLDFGLARDTAGDAHITGEGQVVGTPAYMSPEQANGDPTDGRTDLFSLGVVLYRLATGVLPFRGDSTMAVLTSLATQDPVPPRRLRPELPEQINDLILKLLIKDREDRSLTAAGVAARLAPVPSQTVVEIGPLSNEIQNTDFDFEVCAPTPDEMAVAKPEVIDEGRRKQRRGRWILPAVCVASLMLLLAGVWKIGSVIFEVKTARGTFIIETDDPNVGVVVKRDGAVIKDRTRDREIDLRVGDYTIELAEGKDGLRLNTSSFTIERDGKAYVKVRLEKTKPDSVLKKEPTVLPPVFVPTYDDGASPLDALEAAKIPASERFPWQPAKELVAVVGSHRMKHWAPIQRVVCSPKGDQIASYGADGVRIWDAATFTEKAHLDFKAAENTASLNFSPDGTRLTVYVQGHGTRILDISTLPPRDIATIAGVNRWYPFSPDGKQIVLNLEGLGKTLEVWDVSTADPKWIARFEVELPSNAFTMPAANRVLTVSPHNPADKTKEYATLWEVNGTYAKALDKLNYAAPEFALSHDGKWFANGTHEKKVMVYDLSGGKFADKRSFTDDQIGGRPSQFLFVRGTDELSYVCYDGPWTIRDLKSGKMLRPTTTAEGSGVGEYRPGGGGLIAAMRANAQALVSLNIDGEGRVTVAARADTLVHALSAPCANRFISWEADPNPPRRWDLDGPEPKALPIKQLPNTRGLTVLPDGRLVGSTSKGNGRLCIIDPNKDDAADAIEIVDSPKEVKAVACSRSGRWLAAANWIDGERWPRLIDLAGPKPRMVADLKEYPAKGACIAQLDFSPGEQFLVAVGASYGPATEACVWDLRARQPKFVTRFAGATSSQFAIDSATFILGFGDGKIKLIDYSTGAFNEVVAVQPFARTVLSAQTLVGGKRLMASDDTGLVKFIKIPTGEIEKEWQFPGWTQLFLANDGRHVLTCNANGTGYVLRLVEAPKVQPSPLDRLDAAAIPAIERVPELPKDAVAVIGSHVGKHWGGVYSLASTPDGKLLASAGADGFVRLFDPIAQKELDVVSVQSSGHIRIALTRDGRTLAVSGTGMATVWSIENSKLRKRFEVPGGGTDHALSPDGTKIALTWMHEHIKVFDITGPAPRELTKSLEGHVGSVLTPVFLKGDKWLATTGHDLSVRVWDLTTGKQVHKFGPFGEIGGGLHAVRDGQALVYVMSDGMIRTWDFSGEQPKERAFRLPIGALTIHGAWLSRVTPDGKLLATRAEHQFAQVWNLADPGDKPLHQFDSHSCIPTLTDDGKTLFLANASLASTDVIDLSDPKLHRRTVIPGVERYSPITIRPNGQILGYRVRNFVAGEMYWQGIGARGYGEPQAEPRIIPTTHDSRLAFGRGASENRMYTVRDHVELVEFDLSKPANAPPTRSLRVPPMIRCVHVSADGSTLAVHSGSGETQRIVVLRPVSEGFQEIGRIENLPPLAEKIRLSADGSAVFCHEAQPGGSGPVRRWDVGSKEAKVIQVPEMFKGCALWDLSDDGRRLGVRHGNGMAVFDVTGPEPRMFGKVDGPVFGGYPRFALSPDGRLLVVGGQTGSSLFHYCLYETSTGSRKREWTFPYWLSDIRFAPDGRHLLTQNTNGTGYVIRLQRGPLAAKP